MSLKERLPKIALGATVAYSANEFLESPHYIEFEKWVFSGPATYFDPDFGQFQKEIGANLPALIQPALYVGEGLTRTFLGMGEILLAISPYIIGAAGVCLIGIDLYDAYKESKTKPAVYEK